MTDQPGKEPMSRNMETINFLSQGQRIDGTLFLPNKRAEKYPGVIFFHGLTSSEKRYLEFAQLLAENDIAGLTINMRGHGSSEGDPDKLMFHDALVDAQAAYDFFAGLETIDATRVGLCGSSWGATLAAMTTQSREIKSLLLRAPALYTAEMMDMTFNQVMSDEGNIFHAIKDGQHAPAINAISRFHGSLLVVTSGLDALLPTRLTDLYITQAVLAKKKERVVMEGVPHPLDGQKNREDFAKIMLEWFGKTL